MSNKTKGIGVCSDSRSVRGDIVRPQILDTISCS